MCAAPGHYYFAGQCDENYKDSLFACSSIKCAQLIAKILCCCLLLVLLSGSFGRAGCGSSHAVGGLSQDGVAGGGAGAVGETMVADAGCARASYCRRRRRRRRRSGRFVYLRRGKPQRDGDDDENRRGKPLRDDD